MFTGLAKICFILSFTCDLLGGKIKDNLISLKLSVHFTVAQTHLSAHACKIVLKEDE